MATGLATGLVIGPTSACGGPVLQNAPRPNPVAVAGGAAALAAAITLASPDTAARNLAAEDEARRRDERDPPAGSRQMPSGEVLDRLDAAERDAAKDPGAAPPGAPPAGERQPGESSGPGTQPRADPASPTSTSPLVWPPASTMPDSPATSLPGRRR